MDKIRELDINKSLDLLRNQKNDKNIQQIVESLEAENYSDLLNYIQAAKDSFEKDTDITFVLLLLELLSYIQLDKQDEAKICLKQLYSIIPEDDGEKLLILGELAFQVDGKMARRVFSQLVKLLEEEPQTSPSMIGKSYLLLAEVEESMNKLPRSVKYYQKALSYISDDDPNSNAISFLHYKIGVLYSATDKKTEAIESLTKGLALANDQGENKIHILVSIGTVYASMEKKEEAFSYLTKALEMIEESRLKNKIIHAETLIELAFYYFDSGRVNEALPFYEKALAIYHKEKGIPNKKLGMIYMQYAYCLEHSKKPNISHAGMQYEYGLRYLEESGDRELYENALMDVISFFNVTKNNKKKRFYENKILKASNN